ncbi:effector binding domain-containing protein [Aquimarina sp. MAR_2010_214]|uniref:effector binding domain-containing protein n=1 Tax=Aquimarina sp. MAR_2010_214 TaxID=1250026 RepID=UPI0013045F22|nr:effector binding domain-containing protein [Aquimarina sp. MAR_2010_214]
MIKQKAYFLIYINYEKDHTKPYDTILGCKVSTLNEIPNGMIRQEFEQGNYTKFISKGNLLQGEVYNS